MITSFSFFLLSFFLLFLLFFFLGSLHVFLQFLQPVHGDLGGGGNAGGELKRSPGERDFTSSAFPYSAGDSFDGSL